MSVSDTDKTILAVQQAINNDRDQLFHYRKRENLFIAELYRQAGKLNYYRSMLSCSTYLKFAYGHFDEESETLPVRLVETNACRVRHCPLCQYYRSRCWQAKTFQALPKILSEYPNHPFIFLTLTRRNCQITELRDNIKEMNEAYRKLTQRKGFGCLGWIKATEVTRAHDVFYEGKFLRRTGLTWVDKFKKTLADFKPDRLVLVPTSECHPHHHIMQLKHCGYLSGHSYKTQAQYTQEYRAAAKLDYQPIVHVKAVKDIIHSVPEIVKYQTKSQDLKGDPSWLMELTDQMHGVRAVTTGGVLSKYLKEVGDERTFELSRANDGLAFSGATSTWCWGEENTTRYSTSYNIDNSPVDFVDIVNLYVP